MLPGALLCFPGSGEGGRQHYFPPTNKSQQVISFHQVKQSKIKQQKKPSEKEKNLDNKLNV